jgi:hypothetical protein
MERCRRPMDAWIRRCPISLDSGIAIGFGSRDLKTVASCHLTSDNTYTRTFRQSKLLCTIVTFQQSSLDPLRTSGSKRTLYKRDKTERYSAMRNDLDDSDYLSVRFDLCLDLNEGFIEARVCEDIGIELQHCRNAHVRCRLQRCMH